MLKVRDVAELLNLSESQILRLIRTGRLKAYNHGVGKLPRFRIERDDLESYRLSAVYVPEGTVPQASMELPPGVLNLV